MLRAELLIGIVTSSLALSCGGSGTPAESSASSNTKKHVESEPDAAESTAESEASDTPKRATCDDGTCTPCGDAFCPTGWYCDETAQGSPRCGWLPECAQKSGCACVKKALGCACEEQAGAPHVSCR